MDNTMTIPIVDEVREMVKPISWGNPAMADEMAEKIKSLLASAVSRERGLVYKEIREKMSHLPVYHTLDDDEPELVALLSMEDILSDLLTQTDTIIK